MITVKFDWEKDGQRNYHKVSAPTYEDCLETGFDELTTEGKTIINYQIVEESQ